VMKKADRNRSAFRYLSALFARCSDSNSANKQIVDSGYDCRTYKCRNRKIYGSIEYEMKKSIKKCGKAR